MNFLHEKGSTTIARSCRDVTTNRHEQAQTLRIRPPGDEDASAESSGPRKPSKMWVEGYFLTIHCLVHVLNQAPDITLGGQEAGGFAEAHSCDSVEGKVPIATHSSAHSLRLLTE